jgi:hypothetical protein
MAANDRQIISSSIVCQFMWLLLLSIPAYLWMKFLEYFVSSAFSL